MRKILIFVEKNKPQAGVVTALADKGYDLFVTKDDEMAWCYLFSEEKRPDLIIMYMPQKGDVSFLKKKHDIRELRDIPVIFLLEQETKNREDQLSAEVKHDHWLYLCLPVSTEELVERVELMASLHSRPGRLEEIISFNQLIRLIDYSQKTKRILLVETETKRQRPLRRLLENESFEVIGCTSSHIAWLRLVTTRPDIIIWSTCFEGKLGWNQFIERKAGLLEHKEIPILFFVSEGSVELEDINDWGKEAKWQAISFPFERKDLIEAINQLLSSSVTG